MLKMKQLWFLFFVLENFNLNLLFLRLILKKKKKPIMPKIFVYQFAIPRRGSFRTPSNIYDEAFSKNCCCRFSKKRPVLNVC